MGFVFFGSNSDERFRSVFQFERAQVKKHGIQGCFQRPGTET